MNEEGLENGNPASPPAQHEQTKKTKRARRFLNWLATGWRLFAGIALVIGVASGTYFLYQEYRTNKLESRQFRILVPFLANKGEYLDFIQSGTPPKEPILKVSQDFRNAVSAAAAHWFDEPYNSENNKLRGKVDFYYFPEGYDSDSYRQAFDKALQAADLDGREVVAVIGNVTSTATSEYGKLCGQKPLGFWENLVEWVPYTKKKTVQLPMILPLATATNLMHNLTVSGVPAVIRLPPTNDEQAKLFSSFLRHHSGDKPALRVLVIKDLSNRFYSEDLLDGLREDFVQTPLKDFVAEQKKHPNQIFPEDFGTILGVAPVGGDGTGLFMYPNMNGLQPDALLILGMTDASLETLAQARAEQLKFRYIVLSDGAIDENLLKRVQSVVQPEELKKIYLSFPLPCPVPKDFNEIMDGKAYVSTMDMTHGLYVIDSVYVIMSLLQRGVQGGEVGPMRAFVSREINGWQEDAKQNDKPKRIDVRFHGDRSYSIDQFGNSVGLDYHLYSVVRRGQDGSSVLGWIHAKDCPIEMEKKLSSLRCDENPAFPEELRKGPKPKARTTHRKRKK